MFIVRSAIQFSLLLGEEELEEVADPEIVDSDASAEMSQEGVSVTTDTASGSGETHSSQALPCLEDPQDHLQSVLEASSEEHKRWQSKDSMLAQARKLAKQNSGENERVTFLY